MKKLTLSTITILVVSLFIFSLFMPFADGPDIEANAAPTRASGEDLEIENETVKFELTGNRYGEYDTIFILNNASLEIIGGTVKAKRVICRSNTVNSTLRIISYDETPGLLSVTEGIVNIKATNIEIMGSSISVINGTTAVQTGEVGGSSEISLISKGSDLKVNDSELSVLGHNGGLGDQDNFGGAGGDARLYLGTSNGHSMQLSGSEFIVEGGAGGDAYASGIVAGLGGNVKMTTRARTVDIRSCDMFIKGGKGGGHSSQSQGAYGGQTEMKFESDLDLILLATDIEAKDGLDTTLVQKGLSRVMLSSKNGQVLWDHAKSPAEKMDVLSYVTSDVFQIDAENGAKLHQVDSGSEPPTPSGNTVLEVYWWANIRVRDLYGDALPGAAITWTIDPDPVPYPQDGSTILTDDDGNVDVEVVGRLNQDYLRYTFNAEIQGGARGNSDQFRFERNQNERVDISVTRMILEIVKPDLSNVQGGVIQFEGTAQPGNSAVGNVVHNVSLYLDEEVIGYAVDVASAQGAPAYSIWELIWDSSNTPDGEHTLTMVGTDDSYTVRVNRMIRVNFFSVNHMPELHTVTINDVDGPKHILPGEKIEVHVDQEEEENTVLAFNIEAYDMDVLSEILGVGEGKKIVKAGMELIYNETGAKIIQRTTLIVGGDDIEKYNISGGFKFSFNLNTITKPGSNDPFDPGEYKLVFYIEDDGGLISVVNNFIFFDLKFDFYPYVDVFIEPNIKHGEDRTSTHESFSLSTPEDNDEEGSNTYTVTFNLTDCKDRDDLLWSSDPVMDQSWSNLRYTVEIRDHNNVKTVVFGPDAEGSSFDYTFDVGDLADKEEGEFVIVVTATDKQGLQTEFTVLARVTHNAPMDPISVIGIITHLDSDIVNVEYGSVFFVLPALFLLILVSYVGFLFFVQRKNLSDKKGKMAILDRKKEQEHEEKGTSTIEDEVNMGIKDSKKYLESTGASKGKDKFLEELEAARGEVPAEEINKDPVPPQPAQKPLQQTPPTPVQPAQQAPPALPQSVSPPPVPTQAPPRPPVPTQAPPGPPVPTQAPPGPPVPTQAPPRPPVQAQPRPQQPVQQPPKPQ